MRVTVRPSSLRQQLVVAGSDQIDQVLIQRFLFGEGLTFTHGGFSERAVASAALRDAAQVGGGVVLHLLLHHGVHLSADQHRMRRAGCGTGRHGGDVAGFQDEEARGGGARSTGRHVGNHRNGRSDDLFDGGAHGVHEAARRVEPDQHQRCLLRTGLCDGTGDDFDGDGMHHAIHVHRDHSRRRRGGLCYQR